MLFTVHLLAGAVIGKYFDNVAIIIVIALISHYVLDFIPHFSPRGPLECKKNPMTKECIKKALPFGSEMLFGIFFALFFMYLNPEKFPLMFLGAFFAFFPDLLCFVSWRHNINFLNKTLPRPGNALYNRTISLFWGMLANIVIAVVAVFLLVPGLVGR